jgi:hypothetical protein
MLLNIVQKSSSSTDQLIRSMSDMITKLTDLVEQRDRMRHQHAILRSLRYDDMKDRQERVHRADDVTLGWLLKGSDIRFVEWLEDGEQLYWVKGKVSSL